MMNPLWSTKEKNIVFQQGKEIYTYKELMILKERSKPLIENNLPLRPGEGQVLIDLVRYVEGALEGVESLEGEEAL